MEDEKSWENGSVQNEFAWKQSGLLDDISAWQNNSRYIKFLKILKAREKIFGKKPW